METSHQGLLPLLVVLAVLVAACEGGAASKECNMNGEKIGNKCLCFPGYNATTNCKVCNDGGNITAGCMSCLDKDFHYDATLKQCESNLVTTTSAPAPPVTTTTRAPAPPDTTTTSAPAPPVTTTVAPAPPVTTTRAPQPLPTTTTAAPKVTTAAQKKKKKNETKGMGGWAILGIVFGSLAAVGGAVFGFIWWKRRTGGTVARHSLSFYGGNDEGREYSLI